MKKIKILTALLLILSQLIAIAQTNQYKMLEIGDKVPDELIGQMLNYPSKTAKVSDFRGKILVLDFWMSTCSACIAGWPKVMKLQDRFKDKVQIIVANYGEDLKKINEVIQKQKKLNGIHLDLPVSYGNTEVIKQLIPKIGFPHILFIDQQGILQYVTNSGMLNDVTLNSMIEGRKIDVQNKNDMLKLMDYDKPLYIAGNVGRTDSGQNVVMTTTISPFSYSNTPTAFVRTTSKEKKVMYNGNMDTYYPIKKLKYLVDFSIVYLGQSSPLGMFQWLYGNSPWKFINTSRIELKNVDSTKVLGVIDGVYQPQNIYTLQFTAKRFIPLEILRRKVISDVEFYFNLRTGWQKQTKKCYVISRNDQPLPKYSSGDKKEIAHKTIVHFNKSTMAEFVEKMEGRLLLNSPYPLVDETDFKGELGEIKIEAADGEMDFKTIVKKLEKFGLKITLEDRSTDVLVIEAADK